MLHFPEQVGPRILSLESVDYFGATEYFSENFDVKAINWSSNEKLSLYVNEPCD